DTGGSVRGPASFCGVFGIKFTAGLWPMNGIFPMSKSLDSLGVLTKLAKDAASIFQSLNEGQRLSIRTISTARIGVPRAYFFKYVEPSVSKMIDEVIRKIGAMGAEVIEIDPPYLLQSDELFQQIGRTELRAFLGDSLLHTDGH